MRLILALIALCGFVAQAAIPAPVLISPDGWGFCLIVPQACPGWKQSPYDPDLLLIPARGANTVAVHYVVTATDAHGAPRLFIGDFAANGANGRDNNTVIYAGELKTATVQITEIQGPDAFGNAVPPVVYEAQVLL